jgi:hypothetical protein
MVLAPCFLDIQAQLGVAHYDNRQCLLLISIMVREGLPASARIYVILRSKQSCLHLEVSCQCMLPYPEH